MKYTIIVKYNIAMRYIDFHGLVNCELIRNGHYSILRHVKVSLHELVCDSLVRLCCGINVIMKFCVFSYLMFVLL